MNVCLSLVIYGRRDKLLTSTIVFDRSYKYYTTFNLSCVLFYNTFFQSIFKCYALIFEFPHFSWYPVSYKLWFCYCSKFILLVIGNLRHLQLHNLHICHPKESLPHVPIIGVREWGTKFSFNLVCPFSSWWCVAGCWLVGWLWGPYRRLSFFFFMPRRTFTKVVVCITPPVVQW